ncbi:hypothetical protein VTK73DRAFT_1158 [Phialemonium thermophilum]|uniref:Uncharacterized protein n=1 Tax=Phialemonium thermophilum TaxID=223376 RepID=A0ABR3VTV6_9PEZI
MEAATLQAPATGKSRFSKALPAPPTFLAMETSHQQPPQQQQPSRPQDKKPLPSLLLPSQRQAPVVVARKPLPRAGAAAASPTPPPSVSNPASQPSAMAKPAELPLPPLPLKSGPPSATIARRPVALADGNPPSPSDSSPLSSLLSAYSNRSSDSTMRSSAGDDVDMTTGYSPVSTFSPGKDEEKDGVDVSNRLLSRDELFLTPYTPAAGNANLPEPTRSSDATRTPAGERLLAERAPVPPAKDGRRPQPCQDGQTDWGASAAALTQPPTPQGALRRRRSANLSESKEVPGLGLPTTNTNPIAAASSTTLQNPQPGESPPNSASESAPDLPSSSLPTPPSSRFELSPSIHASFPGRNIRPVASQKLGEQRVDPETMGHASSKLRKLSRDAVPSAKDGSVPHRPIQTPTSTTYPARKASLSNVQLPLPVARLPTPDYDKDDVKNSVLETVVSPVSPTSSPELPPDTRPTAESSTITSAQREIRPMRSASLENNNGNSAVNQPAPATLAICGGPVGLPSSPSPSRGMTPSPGQSQFPTRTTSRIARSEATSSLSADRKEDEAEPAKPRVMRRTADNGPSVTLASVSETQPDESLMTGSEEQQWSTKTRDDPFANDSTDLTDSSRKGPELFPTSWSSPIPEGTIFDAPPLRPRNHQCLTRHRIMNQSRNTYYPVACQTCGIKDTSVRHTCGSCWLRVCTSCRTTLYKLNGDLAALIKHNEEVLVEQVDEGEGHQRDGPAQPVTLTTVAAA